MYAIKKCLHVPTHLRTKVVNSQATAVLKASHSLVPDLNSAEPEPLYAHLLSAAGRGSPLSVVP
jgi:hypothetical protein